MHLIRSWLRLLLILFILLGTSGFLYNSNSHYRLTSLCVVSDMSERNHLALAERVSQALDFHKRGDVNGAISAYEGVIPDLPNGQLASTIHSNVGALYMNVGDYDTAKEHFIKAVEVHADSAQAHFNLAVILTTKFSDHSGAFGHCKSALRLDPAMYKAVHLIGNIMQNMGREEEAERFFVAAESMARGQSEAKVQDLLSDNAADSLSSRLREKYPIFNAHIGDSASVKLQGGELTMTATWTCISERPLAFRVSNLMKEEECVRIIGTAKPIVERSFVMGGGGAVDVAESSSELDSAIGQAKDAYRTSKNAWLPRDEVASIMQLRLATVTGLPLLLFQQKSEDLQVVQYEQGGQFKVHQDSSAFHSRFLTALLYLNDVPSGLGGETWFPFSGPSREFPLTVEEAIASALSFRDNRSKEGNGGIKRVSSSSAEPSSSSTTPAAAADVGYNADGSVEAELGLGIDSGGSGVAVSPVRGDAIVFFNHLVDGTLDPAAVHAGLPVLSFNRGEVSGGFDQDHHPEKWIANYWVDLDTRILLERQSGK